MSNINMFDEEEVIEFSKKLIKFLPKFKKDPDLCNYFEGTYSNRTRLLQIVRIGAMKNSNSELMVRCDSSMCHPVNYVDVYANGELKRISFFPKAISTHLSIKDLDGSNVSNTITLPHLQFNKDTIHEELFMYSTLHEYPIIQYLIYSLLNADVAKINKPKQFTIAFGTGCEYTMDDVFKLYNV